MLKEAASMVGNREAIPFDFDEPNAQLSVLEKCERVGLIKLHRRMTLKRIAYKIRLP